MRVPIPYEPEWTKGDNEAGMIPKADIVIAIDPDTHLSGVARLDVAERKMWADTLPFPDVVDFVRKVCREGKKVLVVIEDSWSGGANNWHLHVRDNRAVAAKKGYAVGAMHSVGQKLAEMLEWYGIHVHTQRPLVKCWSGPDRKITHEEITKVTKWERKRSNQEMRDAALLAWYCSGLPIKL